MIQFNKPFEYDSNTGTWSLELQKAPKMFSAQCGVKFTFNPGYPTGESEEFYKSNSKSGLLGSTLEIRAFDNLSGWTSYIQVDFHTLLEKLIEIMPKDKIRYTTFVLASEDKKSSSQKK